MNNMNRNDIFEAALKEMDFDKVNECVQESINESLALFDELKFDALEKELRNKKTLLSLFVAQAVSKKSIDFLLGRYVGFADGLDRQLPNEYERKGWVETLNTFDVAEVQLLANIIVAIYQNPGIQHDNLTKKVGADENALTKIINALIEHKLVANVQPGEFVYYYLTKTGQIYYNNNKALLKATQTDLCV